MKTTNFELSKKLAEIGFKAESDFVYVDTRKSWKSYNCPRVEEYMTPVFVPFWNLHEGDPELELVHTSSASSDGKYGNRGYNDSEPLNSYDLETLLDALPEFNRQSYFLTKGGIAYLDPINGGENRQSNESLADTAARLLIKLHEQGIINFKS